jgi:hypothetical protein
MLFFFRSPTEREKIIPNARYVVKRTQKLNWLTVKDYFGQLKELLTKAIRQHGLD